MLADSQIRRNVTDELAWAPDVAAAEIGVTVDNGVVTLLGHVPSFWKRASAIRATREVRGVRGIAEELKVTLPNDDRLSDAKIAARALFRLASDVSIPNGLVKVNVEKGVVTLTGSCAGAIGAGCHPSPPASRTPCVDSEAAVMGPSPTMFRFARHTRRSSQ